jgi:general secretion pathway protein C
MQRLPWIRFATFLVWLLAAGCAVYWALQFVRGPNAPLSTAVAAPALSASEVDAQALARGLGGGLSGGKTSANSPTEAVAAPSALSAARFVLTGVVVQKSGRQANPQGVALIAVDGKPPRPYRVGSQLADGVVLHSVSAGKALLSASADATPGLTLELPQLTTAIAGTALAVRPALPAVMPAAIPAGMPPTMSPSNNPMAGPSAAGMLGQRPSRPLANRQREAAKEATRDQAAP